MSDKHLFDPSVGATELDALLHALEQDLQPLRWNGALPTLDLPQPHPRVARRNGRRWFGIAAAASLLVAGMLWVVQFTTQPTSPFHWNDMAGAIRLEQGWHVGDSLEFGSLIETDAEGEIELGIADVGHLRLGKNGRLRIKKPLDAFGDGRFRLELFEGDLEVWVTAPARAFLVETPWFEVWDLGCQYRLLLDSQGNGEVEVLSGAVQFVGGDQSIRLAPGDLLTVRGGRAVTG